MLLSSLDDDDDDDEEEVVVVVSSRRKSCISSSLALALGMRSNAPSVCLSKLPNAKMCSSERRHRERLRETERETFRERERCDMC